MRSLAHTIIGCLAITLGACGNSKSVEQPRPARSNGELRPRQHQEVSQLYDTKGRLLPSKEVRSGLPIPRGATLFRTEERRFVYRTRVPVKKVIRYFSKRLITGQVDALGGGKVFRRSIPRGARGHAIELEVSVLPSSKVGTRVEIRELRPVPAKPPSQEELRKKLERAQRFAE